MATMLTGTLRTRNKGAGAGRAAAPTPHPRLPQPQVAQPSAIRRWPSRRRSRSPAPCGDLAAGGRLVDDDAVHRRVAHGPADLDDREACRRRSCCAVATSSLVVSGTSFAGFGCVPSDTCSRSREPALRVRDDDAGGRARRHVLHDDLLAPVRDLLDGIAEPHAGVVVPARRRAWSSFVRVVVVVRRRRRRRGRQRPCVGSSPASRALPSRRPSALDGRALGRPRPALPRRERSARRTRAGRGFVEATSCTVGVSPIAWSACTASAFGRPTSFRHRDAARAVRDDERDRRPPRDRRARASAPARRRCPSASPRPAASPSTSSFASCSWNFADC